jgi:nitroreductase
MKNPHFIKLVRKPSDLEHEDEEVLLTHIRMKAHLMDKELQTSTGARTRFSQRKLQDLCGMFQIYREKFDASKADYRWAEKIADLYGKALADPENFSYPWLRKQAVKIAESELIKLLTTRRSIRKFTPEPVDEELIRKAIALTLWAPTNCNQQSLRFIVVKDPGIRKLLVHGGMHGASSPCVISVLADMRFYSQGDIECPAHDAGAAIQTMLLAFHCCDVGTCYTASLAADSKKNRRILRVRSHEKIMALIWVGRYEHVPIPPDRRDVSEIIRYL